MGLPHIAVNPHDAPQFDHEVNFKHASYMEKSIQPHLLTGYIELGVRALSTWKDKLHAIAFTGMSGALLAPPIAIELDKTLILVRKPDDSSHSVKGREHNSLIEGDHGAKTYIIVDDFICTGKTKERIVNEIKRVMPDATCLGFLAVHKITEDKLKNATNGKPYPLE